MSINPSKANSSTTGTFVTSLVTNVALLVVQVGVFLVLKQRFGRVYAPRTYLPPPDKRAQELPKGWWRWIPAVLLSNPMEIIHKNGLDAYMFLRFLRMLSLIFLVFTLITWPIILPLDAVRISGSSRSGLDLLSWGNITDTDEKRYAGHVVVAYILTIFVVYMARREMLHFVHMRHQFLASKGHSKHAQARTVLLTSVPDDLASDHDLREFASFVPGGIEKTWVFRDTKELNELFKEREKACKKLESAVSSVLRSASKTWHARQTAHSKEVKQLQKARKKELKVISRAQKKGRVSADIDPEQLAVAPTPLGVTQGPLIPEKASFEWLNTLVPRNERPTHHVGALGFLGFIGLGRKVDTIDYCKAEVSRLNKEINELRQHVTKGKSLGSAFVECNLQLGAHVLAQCVSYHEPLVMVDKWIEIHPRDVIWDNLDDSAYEVRTRYVTSWMASIALIILWAFPVAFIGSLSNLDDLCAQFSWLRWVCKAPKPLPGLLQGVLPPLLLAILMAILPLLLRALAWYENIPLYSLLSVSVYKRYYAFLVLNGFLIVTLSSAITATIYDILQNPAKAVEDLAARLPDASIFFLTYMATQGLAGAASALIQLVRLIMWFIQKWLLGRTPRQAYKVSFVMPSADFGVVLPRMSLLATIGFAYSVISPIINGLAMLSFFLFFLAWKFLLTQVYDQPDEMETGGLYFPLAVSNLFVGLYIEQICLLALFALKIPSNPTQFIAQVVVMAVLIAGTFAAQLTLRHSFEPITQYLPMSLATKKMAERYRRHSKSVPAVASVVSNVIGKEAEDDVVDLFNRDRMKSVLRRRLKLDPNDKKTKEEKRKEKEAEKKPDVLPEPEELPHSSATALIGQAQPQGMQGEPLDGHKEDGIDEGKEEPRAGPSNPAPPGPAANQDPTIGVRKADPTLLEGQDAHPLERKVSNASTASAKSNKSAQPKKEEKPKFPTFDPPAAALRPEDDDEDAEEYFEEHAFDHPSTYVEQVWIWVPKDSLGFSEIIVEDLKAVGVDASDLGATMDERGTVEVTRNPPDEEWQGGHDR